LELAKTMSDKFAISWIYHEFKIARMHRGEVVEHWTAPFEVKDLLCLNQALIQASEHIDLNKGGEVSLAYEDDLHTHEFFDVPQMAAKDLNKLLLRKVDQTKPFEDDAAWCFHEAKHNEEEEGILLHLMPKRIVDATVRMCQEFYLTPRKMVPLTEIISEVVVGYKAGDDKLLLITALFQNRTEILLSLGNGEVIFVRELPYCGIGQQQERLIVDINRTIPYARQRFARPVDEVWLIGEETDSICEAIQAQVDAKINYDPEGLDGCYWAKQVSNLTSKVEANFIPLLAQKEINRTLFYRTAMMVFVISVFVAILIVSSVELAIKKQAVDKKTITAEIYEYEDKISRIKNLIDQKEREEKRLQMLQANSNNLPALLLNHMGNMLPEGLIMTNFSIKALDNQWKIEIKGQSDLELNDIVFTLKDFEKKLQQPPWNITISKSWKESWYGQLESGAASQDSIVGFDMEGWMKQ
jgi:hypothetical protein